VSSGKAKPKKQQQKEKQKAAKDAMKLKVTKEATLQKTPTSANNTGLVAPTSLQTEAPMQATDLSTARSAPAETMTAKNQWGALTDGALELARGTSKDGLVRTALHHPK
jgi:hypothetical protein